MSVTVEEVDDDRRMLETSIYNLIHIFEKNNSVSVDSISLLKDSTVGKRLPEIVSVSIEVRL